MNAREQRKLLKKMAEGYTVTEKKTVRQIRQQKNGETITTSAVEEIFERYIPPSLQAMEILYSLNSKRYNELQ